MLKKILSISGKPGLYELVSYGKNLIIVENLKDKKRMPAYTRDKIISLGDISMYTYGEEVALSKVFTSVYEKFEGKTINADEYKTPERLKEFFLQVLPDYDQERVYNNDIKKVIAWYNILVEAGYTKFEEEADEAAETAEEEK
ncbi:MAG: DUF5606 domain-containing protein [Muribaculaceae bacterium]